MTTGTTLNSWLDALGYSGQPGSLHCALEGVAPRHPYALELWDMLRPDGDICAKAVFDVEGVPTVVFLDRSGRTPLSESDLDLIRQRLWNQNLVSVLLVANGETLEPHSVHRRVRTEPRLKFHDASAGGEFSAAEITSSEIQQRLPSWFRPDRRVDHQLLQNLGEVVKDLCSDGMDHPSAHMLIGQILFIAYLEHRGIVSDVYRQRRKVKALHTLISEQDGDGVSLLISNLRKDFNGDFLAPDTNRSDLWLRLSKSRFNVLQDFLEHVNLRTGQRSFWNYDFSKIPVELLSGIYESFLGDEQEKLAAYYTPRHLATLAVDQALLDSPDILKEVAFDGACGSGILLTTFFRKLLGAAEATANRQLTLKERSRLLLQHVFGSDVSEAAVRVTAFSLYLSLLERLQPADILALQEQESVKLPTLRGNNLHHGNSKGDFFSDRNGHLNSTRFTLLLSNPPWREPKATELTSADIWAKQQGIPRTLRQMAADYSLRALDYVHPGGRVCLILPVTQFLAPTSESFLRGWLQRFRPIRLINFGDLQQLIFSSASNSCVVVVASPRHSEAIPIEETFEYWVPKADVSLALGRLTLQSGDRYRLQTQAVYDNRSRLVTLMWGSEADLALLGRLRSYGCLNDLIGSTNKTGRWVSRKGFHMLDNHNKKPPVSAELLYRYPFLKPDSLNHGALAIGAQHLSKFPKEIATVARLGDELLSVFDGPRILFPDGFSREREIRAAYYDGPASFTHSISVIAGPPEDANLLRFATVFLRSKFARYLLIMTSWQVLCDRNAVRLINVKEFPFFPPERSDNPKRAQLILKKVADITRTIASASPLEQASAYDRYRDKLDGFVYDYYGLDERERVLVEEAVEVFFPSIRPRAYKSLYTPMQFRARMTTVEGYAARLHAELEAWRERTGGAGRIQVNAVSMSPRNCGPVGVVRVTIGRQKGLHAQSVTVSEDDRKVERVLVVLKEKRLSEFQVTKDFHFIPDVLVWAGSTLYLVRPLVRRYWLQRSAMRDARRIVEEVQRGVHME